MRFSFQERERTPNGATAMDWAALRDEFPVTKTWTYMDHAAVAPLSRRARDAIRAWADDLTEHGEVHEPEWDQRVEAVRALAGRLLQADPLDIAFIKNTSEGIGIVAEGFAWKPGDNMVTAVEEYPANIYPWMNLANRGVEVRQVPSRDRRIHIDDIRASMNDRTRIVSLSAVEFASGFRNDLDAIGSLCRERGVVFFVDAIQALGALPVNGAASPIDFLAADAHKWLLGPQGAGILYVRRELVERLHAVGVGWNSVVGSRNFSTIDFQLKPHAGRWESGTLNVAGITGLGASLELLLEVGIAAIAARVLELTDYLCEQAARRGWEVYSSRRPEDKSAIVSLLARHDDPRRLVRRCRDAHIVINQRHGRLRVSPHAYNTCDEIDRLLEVLAERV